MTDLSETIAPKSEQLNADDLIGGPRTVRITKVSRVKADQPIAINFEDDDGRPYYPCLSMRRVLLFVWGKEGKTYVGRRMTLYRDPAVRYGGAEIGGIRISHMEGIDEEKKIALTVTRGKRATYTVRPLIALAAAQEKLRPADDIASRRKATLAAFAKLGVDAETVRRHLAIESEMSMTGAHIERLRALYGRLAKGEATKEELFGGDAESIGEASRPPGAAPTDEPARHGPGSSSLSEDEDYRDGYDAGLQGLSEKAMPQAIRGEAARARKWLEGRGDAVKVESV